jgi:hypothetical protein
MELTIKNFQAALSKELLKQAEKTKVRECDETEKDAACFPELFDKIVKHFPLNYLRKIIEQAEKNSWHFRSNHFLDYLKKKMIVDRE